jgi:hypothetical protein
MDQLKGVWICNILSDDKIKTSIKIGYFYNVHQFSDDKIIYNKNDEIHEYDVKANSSRLLYKPQDGGNMRYVRKHGNCLYYIQCLNLNEKPFFIYDLTDKKATQVRSGSIVPLNYYLTNDKKLIISCIDSDIFLIDEKGNILYKFSDRLNGEQGSRPDMGFDISNSAMAPNGKLYAISYRHFHAFEDMINAGDIYLVSLVSGKKINLTNTSEKTELMKGWSPQGNRIIYQEFRSKKLIVAEIG